MSDEQVALLRSSARWSEHGAAYMMESAADRIEGLVAERDTLAEIVAVAKVVLYPGAFPPVLMARQADITPDQAERFSAVLHPTAAEKEPT